MAKLAWLEPFFDGRQYAFLGDHRALKNNFVESFEVFPHWFTVFPTDGLQVIAPTVLRSGAQKLGNKLFPKLLEARNCPCAQPPEPLLDGPRQSQGKYIAQGQCVSFHDVHPCFVCLDVGDCPFSHRAKEWSAFWSSLEGWSLKYWSGMEIVSLIGHPEQDQGYFAQLITDRSGPTFVLNVLP